MDKIKIVVIGIFSAVSSFLGILAIPVYLLVGCNVIDYVTGIIASHYRGEELSSYKGFKGIAKKICMWLLILIGAWVDILIQYAITNAGLPITFPFIVSVVVAIWLVVNEMISILENMVDIGVTIPPFLMPIVKYIKKTTEDAVENGDDTDGIQ